MSEHNAALGNMVLTIYLPSLCYFLVFLGQPGLRGALGPLGPKGNKGGHGNPGIDGKLIRLIN